MISDSIGLCCHGPIMSFDRVVTDSTIDSFLVILLGNESRAEG